MFRLKSKHKDFVNPRKERKEISGTSIRDFIDGSILTRSSVIQQLPFVLFLVILGIYYISNRYKSEKVYRDMLKLETELKELRFESITTSSELIYMSKQSEVLKRVQAAGLDLEESTDPPIVINEDD